MELGFTLGWVGLMSLQGLDRGDTSQQSLLTFSQSSQVHSMKTGSKKVALPSALIPIFPGNCVKHRGPTSLPWYHWAQKQLREGLGPSALLPFLLLPPSLLTGNQENFPSLWNQVSGCIPPRRPPHQPLIPSFMQESWECEEREMPLSAQSFLLLPAKAESHVEMSSAAPSFLPLFPPPLPITPVVSSFENSLLLPMGPTLKNKEGGRRCGGDRKKTPLSCQRE